MKPRILIVAPYSGLSDVAHEVLRERDDVVADVIVGDLVQGLERVLNRGTEQYDIIISRGGTATMLKERTHKPVVDIGVTAYDLTRLIRMIDSYGGKVALVAFKNIAARARAIGEMLNYSPDVFTINDNVEAERCIKELKESSYDLVIGDVVTVRMAAKHGLNGVLMCSGPESMAIALDDAIERYHAEQENREVAWLICEALRIAGNNALVLDESGDVYWSNLQAARLADFLPLVQSAEMHDENDLSEAEQETVMEAEGESWRVRSAAVTPESGRRFRVYSFEKLSFPLAKGRGWGEGVRFHKGPVNPYGKLFSSDEAMRAIQEQIASFAAVPLPLLIVGERGVGKKHLTYEAYKQSALKNHPFLELDCEQLDESSWESFVRMAKSEVNRFSGMTIFFVGMECLSPDLQKAVYRFCKTVEGNQHFRIMATISPEALVSAERGDYYRKLTDAVGELIVRVPPLRERKDSISSLISIILCDLNAALGGNVVGMENDALNLARDYAWYGNTDQLYRVIRELSLSCKRMYIPAADMARALSHEKELQERNDAEACPSGTLNEITRRTIWAVLRAENMNQSRTAKRLGISRSTLWRWLQD